MAPRRRRRGGGTVRSRRTPQSIHEKGYGTLNAQDKTNIVVLTMDVSGNNRDFQPKTVNIQVSGTVGATFVVSLRDGEGTSARTFGPFLVGSTVRQYSFRWPNATQWFSAGKQAELVKIKCLPRQGITTSADNITVVMSARVLLSDYNSGLTLDPPNNCILRSDDDIVELG